jgi:hypothetical protein
MSLSEIAITKATEDRDAQARARAAEVRDMGTKIAAILSESTGWEFTFVSAQQETNVHNGVDSWGNPKPVITKPFRYRLRVDDVLVGVEGVSLNRSHDAAHALNVKVLYRPCGRCGAETTVPLWPHLSSSLSPEQSQQKFIDALGTALTTEARCPTCHVGPCRTCGKPY